MARARGRVSGRVLAAPAVRALLLLAVVVLHVFVYWQLLPAHRGQFAVRVPRNCCLELVLLAPATRAEIADVQRPPRPPSRVPRAITLPLVLPAPVQDLPHAAADAPRSAAPLDLSLPREAIDSPVPSASQGAGWVFDRKLARRLEDARRAAASRGTLAARQRAREGVSSDEYARASGNGERVKTDSGCFELREDPDAGGTRWWREPCQDSRVDAWDQAPLEAQE